MPILERMTGFVLALPDMLRHAFGPIAPSPVLAPVPVRSREAERKAALAAAARRRNRFS
ncbi:MAG: hypothetical protein HQM02_04065 [Magnetococcales bacterium]|nr:hypothetical protein [Magnetococcales bacterium]